MPPDHAAVDAARILEVVQRYWGYDTLRPLQHEAINAGVQQRDSLVVMPTGGGKSICYQVPPVLAERCDVVVSPLVSLMKDQVDALRACGYPAVAIHSGLTPQERSDAEQTAVSGGCRLVLVAPERLLGSSFLRVLSQIRVGAFAIDEAHCISHWGHDFRPEYRQLADLKRRFPSASLHAFTATATQRVRADIVAQLRLRDPLVLVGRFDRPNLVFRVVPRDDGYVQTLEVVRRHPGQAGIVYCISRRETEAMAEYLLSAGIRAEHYHAGMEAEPRRRTQERFSDESIDVVVATVAFGMGIDRGDVRYVLHTAMPKSVEHYQQECGRAGRDGLEAECVLLYSGADSIRWERLLGPASDGAAAAEVRQTALALLAQMRRFASSIECRHGALSHYFGQTYEHASCGACDVCLGELNGVEDATVTAQKILSCVARVQERFGARHVVDVLLGENTERVRQLGHNKLSTFGLLRGQPQKALGATVHQLVDLGLLDRTTDEYPILKLNAQSWEVLRGQRGVRIVKRGASGVRRGTLDVESWEGVDRGLFDALRGLRRELAAQRGVPPFVIFNDATLRELARRRPTAPAGMSKVRGVGEQKLADFAEPFLACIRAYCQAQQLSTDVEPPAKHRQRAAHAAPPPPPRALSPAKKQALEMFARGRSVADVAQSVQRATSTVNEYLCEFIVSQPGFDTAPWVSPADFQRVCAAINTLGPTPLTPLHEHLNGEVSYETLKIVRAALTARIGPPDKRRPI